jgi:hypothetical protein
MQPGRARGNNSIIYSVHLSVHEDVTPRGVNPPLQLLLPLNLTIFVNRRRNNKHSLYVIIRSPAGRALLLFFFFLFFFSIMMMMMMMM